MPNCIIKNLQSVYVIFGKAIFSLFELSTNHQQKQVNDSTGRRLAWNKEIHKNYMKRKSTCTSTSHCK